MQTFIVDALCFLILLVILLKIVFLLVTIALKLVNLSKIFEIEKYLNLKSSLVCFTFDVYCFIAMLAREMRAYSAVGCIAIKIKKGLSI